MFPKKAYVDILEHLRSTGFNFKFLLDNVSPGDICIRHDIDFSVDAAYAIAKEEIKLDIRTSYFFTLNSYFYNIFTPNSVKIIHNILNSRTNDPESSIRPCLTYLPLNEYQKWWDTFPEYFKMIQDLLLDSNI